MTSSRPTTVPRLCQKIWDLEERYNLLNLNISGVYVWQACRMHIYYKLAEACDLYEHPHVSHREGWPLLHKLKFFFSGLIPDNPFRGATKTDIAIFDHTRSKAFDNKIVDIYSHFLCEDLRADNASFVVFERPFLNEYVKTPTFERRRVGIIDSLSSIISHIPFMRLSRQERNLVKQLEADICGSVGVNLNLQRLFSKQLRRFKLRRYLYGKLLDRYRIKQVYLVVSYYLGPLIDACKLRGIPVSEIQHGIISKYHLGYSFPDTEAGSLHYFPDYLLEWGGNWPTTQYLPLEPTKLIHHGFRYFDANKAKYQHLTKNPKRVLIVSQSVHGNSLAEFIRNNISTLEGWEIQYKLHPSEFNRASDYPDLNYLAATVDNFSVVTRGDVHELLAEATAVIGVFSTVLFEALEFDCDVYICPLSGWEYVEELLEKDLVKPFEKLNSEKHVPHEISSTDGRA